MVVPSTKKVEVVDKGWQRIALDFEQLKGKVVKIGIMGDASVNGVAIVDYATYNEFGTRHIPARPFMSVTSDRYRDQVYEYTRQLVGQMIDGKYHARRVLALMGLWYQAKVQLVIRDAKTWAVPNLPATAAAKGSSSPLIDTGRMVQSVRYEIID